MAYISNSEMHLAKITKKGNFLFGKYFPKKEILMAYISNSEMLLEKITKKGNYMLENSEKCQKNPKKYRKNSQKFQNIGKYFIILFNFFGPLNSP